MRLRAKIAFLLSGFVILSIACTTFSLSHIFSADQESYLTEYQAGLALFADEQIKTRMGLLHSQLGSLLKADRLNLKDVVAGFAGAAEGGLWEADKLLQSTFMYDGVPPPAGQSPWTLTASANPDGLRWVGRYGSRSITIELRAEWLGSLLKSTQGATAEIIDDQGNILATLSKPRKGADSWRTFNHPALIAEAFQRDYRIPHVGKYQIPGEGSFLGTFLVSSSEPRFAYVISMPSSFIDATIRRTYLKAAWAGGLLVLVAIAMALVFSSSLTAPIHTLIGHARDLASGNFEAQLKLPENRRDEVGDLANTLGTMGGELIKVREDLRRKERLVALGQFSASIAHEIKTPLAGILCNAELMELVLNRPNQDPATLNEALKLIQRETLRANETVSKLMKFARQDKVPDSPVDLCERVRKTVAGINPLLESAGVRVELNLVNEAVTCLGNEDQLHEVLSNLIFNAMHAMKKTEKKDLSISVRKDGDYAVLSVSDTGYGMSPETKARVFEPFFTTKPIGEGTGLGMATCHGIITNHRGSIGIESELGRGTQFIMRFPLHLVQQRAAA